MATPYIWHSVRTNINYPFLNLTSEAHDLQNIWKVLTINICYFTHFSNFCCSKNPLLNCAVVYINSASDSLMLPVIIVGLLVIYVTSQCWTVNRFVSTIVWNVFCSGPAFPFTARFSVVPVWAATMAYRVKASKATTVSYAKNYSTEFYLS